MVHFPLDIITEKILGTMIGVFCDLGKGLKTTKGQAYPKNEMKRFEGLSLEHRSRFNLKPIYPQIPKKTSSKLTECDVFL